jgi:hypothetical protein
MREKGQYSGVLLPNMTLALKEPIREHRNRAVSQGMARRLAWSSIKMKVLCGVVRGKR